MVLTRDLQLADVLLRLPGAPRVVYEAHAVEALMYAERAALYGTAEKSDPRKRARLQAREERVWRGAAAVVTTTAGIRDSFADAYGERPRVHVVPNGCDPPDAPFDGLPEGEPEVLYAGQLYPWKGVDVLVEAFAQVPRGRLVILGGIEGEHDTARVRALVERLGLDGARGHARPRPAGPRGRRAAARDGGRGAVPAHGDDRAPHLAPQGLRGDGGGARHRGLGPALARARCCATGRPPGWSLPATRAPWPQGLRRVLDDRDAGPRARPRRPRGRPRLRMGRRARRRCSG